MPRYRPSLRTVCLAGMALVLSAALAACDRDAPQTQSATLTQAAPLPATRPAEPGGPQVTLVMKTLTNPFFVDMERGARRAAAETGASLQVRAAAQETSIDQQIELVEAAIRERTDAIVIAPGDSAALIPVLRKARDAGIRLVVIDNPLDPVLADRAGLGDVPLVTVDNERGAALAAGYAAATLEGPVDALLVEGIRGAANAEARRRGARQALAAHPNVHIVASETANWQIDEAWELARRMFTRWPDLRLVVCANDMMALGVIRYLKDAGRSDVRVTGYDALPEAREALAQGRLYATVDQRAAEQGELGVRYALRALAGETLPARTVVPVQLVTAPSNAPEPPPGAGAQPAAAADRDRGAH